MASDFDNAFADWWKNDGASPAHREWRDWYFDLYGYRLGRPCDFADRAWQNRFEDMKTAIYLAVRLNTPVKGDRELPRIQSRA